MTCLFPAQKTWTTGKPLENHFLIMANLRIIRIIISADSPVLFLKNRLVEPTRKCHPQDTRPPVPSSTVRPCAWTIRFHSKCGRLFRARGEHSYGMLWKSPFTIIGQSSTILGSIPCQKSIVSRRRYVYPYVHGGITIPQYENTINL